ncbi:MAG: hypothetical protein Kow001_14720 [Acidobacteriota bacterium]
MTGTLWLDLTNILLGVGTLACVGILAGGVLREIWDRVPRLRRHGR